MPRKRNAKQQVESPARAIKTAQLPSISAAEAMSFLREMHGAPTWTAQDMAKSLKISVAEANNVIPLLEWQGYAKRTAPQEWITTPAGETVSGSKAARITSERLEQALDALSQRIVEFNRSKTAKYKVTDAVAFGDFLQPRARVQAAEVGIRLALRKQAAREFDSASERKAEHQILRQLQGPGHVLHVKPYKEWMGRRNHRNLMP
jgi:hypothetical protein